MFRTSNPAFNNDAYKPAQTWDDLGQSQSFGTDDSVRAARAASQAARPSTMTINGTVTKSALMIGTCMVVAMIAWGLCVGSDEAGNPVINGGMALGLTAGGALLGMLTFFVTMFKPKMSTFTAMPYAAMEGAFVGGISAFYAARFATEGDDGGIVLNSGLIFNAALLTFGIFGGLLTAYSLKLVRPNRLFYNITIVGTLGVLAYFLIAMVAGLFGSFSLLSVYDPSNGGLISIGFSLLLVGLASMNLVLDFDQVNVAVKNRAPRYMEWFSGMALLVTLVWLYIEVLRLLAKLQSRD
ncbi:MAG: Bax inhibitor-1/YccA family protein [bacterium]|nr:Bax inhibitor-1/YccA family protein [bacterium]